MSDTKIVALILLILAGFLFWLQSQGKLIPLFQQLFGIGTAGATAAANAASGSGSSPTFAPGTTIIGALGQVLSTAQGAGGVAPAVPKSPVPVTSGDPGGSVVPVLPGFDPGLPGASGSTSGPYALPRSNN